MSGVAGASGGGAGSRDPKCSNMAYRVGELVGGLAGAEGGGHVCVSVARAMSPASDASSSVVSRALIGLALRGAPPRHVVRVFPYPFPALLFAIASNSSW